MSKAPTANNTGFKSDAFETIHSSASALYKISAIDQTTMRGFDATTMTKPPHENRLIPSPEELDAALTLSAERARRMADAFGLKVPGTAPKPAKPKSTGT